MLLAFAPELPDGPVTNAANSLIQAGILGSLVLLFGIALVYVVLRWNKTNELRVKDQKEMATTLVELTTGFKESLGELSGMVNAHTEAVKANTAASVSMERTTNEVVRDAIRMAGYGRRLSPSGGTPAGGSKEGG